MATDRWKEVVGNAKELAKVASEQPCNFVSYTGVTAGLW
jgi:hypothetical protein